MLFHIGPRKRDYYKGLLIKADRGLHEQVVEHLARRQPAPAKVLDFGAGEGALSLRLADAGYDVTAVDIDEPSFNCSDARFVPLDFNNKAAVDAFVAAHQSSFDVVLGIEVIEHIENPWEYVRSLASMLRPGGVIVVTTPNITSWLSRFRFLFAGRFQHFGEAQLSYGHIAPISAWELDLVFRRGGLTEVSVVSAGTLPPVFLTGFNSLLLANLFMLLLRPFMRGLVDGWCIMALGRKPAG
jgi:cyclopropane fatty-acyl-phospholipid synthase-like methyltransferase